jgi:hypothetical protein
MEALKEVAHISGRPGLFRIVKPGRAGVVVEPMDGNGKKEMVSVNAKVSVLKDISIYSEEYNKSTPLADIFTAIREKYGEKVDFDIKNASNEDFFGFLEEIMPDYDRERVYSSDVRKIIQWYNTLSVQMPELFAPQQEEEVQQDTAALENESPAKETKPKKKAAVKKS